jgi:hypothetical protein
MNSNSVGSKNLDLKEKIILVRRSLKFLHGSLLRNR